MGKGRLYLPEYGYFFRECVSDYMCFLAPNFRTLLYWCAFGSLRVFFNKSAQWRRDGGGGKQEGRARAPQSASILYSTNFLNVKKLVLLCLVPPPIKISNYANESACHSGFQLIISLSFWNTHNINSGVSCNLCCILVRSCDWGVLQGPFEQLFPLFLKIAEMLWRLTIMNFPKI